MNTQIQTQEIRQVRNVICPDGRKLSFQIQGQTPKGDYRGFVNSNGKSVSGYIRGRGRGYRFYPFANSQNIDYVRPRTYGIGTNVVLIDDGSKGKIVGIEWDYCTPIYYVRPVGLGKGNRKPVKVQGTNALLPRD